MRLTLDLPAEAEEALQAEAHRHGVEPMDLAVRILLSHLVFLDVLYQRAGRINRLNAGNAGEKNAATAPQGKGKTAAALEAAAFHDRGKIDNRFQEQREQGVNADGPEALSAEAIAARVAAVRSIGAYDTRAASGLPPLLDEDVARASIYGERGS